jgi:hypothetical protein
MIEVKEPTQIRAVCPQFDLSSWSRWLSMNIFEHISSGFVWGNTRERR